MKGSEGNHVQSRPTLRDVAQAAGVSHKTASRVLNDYPFVSDETRARVREAMASLHYEPDSMARSLRAGKDRSIGVIIDSLGDPFFAEAAQAIEAELANDGFLVMVASSHRDAAAESRIADQMIRRRVAALIVCPARPDSEWIGAADIPIVMIDRRVEAEVTATVLVDDVGGTLTVMEHLLAHGHRRIAFLGDPPTIDPALHRIEGYRRALREAGIEVDERLLRDDTLTPHEAAVAVEELLSVDEPPTALFTASRRASLGAVAALHSLHRTDVAIVGFGDIAMSETLTPAVTVIDHSAAEVGVVAAQTLREALASGSGPGGTITLPLQLIERGSGELTPRP